MIKHHLPNKRKEDSFKISLSQQMLPTLANSNLRPAAMRHSEGRSLFPSLNAKPVKAREWSTTEIHQHLDPTIANATEHQLPDTYKLEISASRKLSVIRLPRSIRMQEISNTNLSQQEKVSTRDWINNTHYQGLTLLRNCGWNQGSNARLIRISKVARSLQTSVFWRCTATKLAQKVPNVSCSMPRLKNLLTENQ